MTDDRTTPANDASPNEPKRDDAAQSRAETSDSTPADAPQLDTATTYESLARERADSLADDMDLDTFAVAFNLFRASSRLVQDLESQVHRPLGLSVAGFRILFTIWTLGELQPRQLAQLAGVSRAAVSGVLNTLERDGLVGRHKDSTDGRLINVRLTAEGEGRVKQAYIDQNQRERELFAALERDELVSLAGMIRRLLASPAMTDESEI